jgi:hypothetical protein
MALSYVEYTASGSTNQFDITFDYIDRTHVKVYVDNVEDTSFTFINDSRVQTSTTPSNGAIVKIDRDTPTDARLVDFQDGSVLTETDLDKSANQNFYIAQETTDEVESKLGQNNAGVYDALNKRIINVAEPTASSDAATKNYIDTQTVSAATSATNAANSATAAASSASAASTSETNAATSETNAATSETNASTSASNAASSASAASSSATSASNSASTATTQASNASTSASNAATSASNASTSESNAATSESNAATSATNASNAQTAAETAQAAAEAAADSIDDTYLGAKASNPTVDNDGDTLTVGDWYFNTTSNQTFIYNGSSWDTIAPDLIGDATPQLGGNLDTNGNDINFGDNDKANFGAGSDLQIYHDSADSYVQDAGIGRLILKTNGTRIQLNGGDDEMIRAVKDGTVKLFYDNAEKLETTSTGVTVTGTVVSDGLTVDTNTLYVDSSNNRVGIGTTIVDSLLHLQKTDATSYSATATDGQVGVGPTIYLENPANSNATVGGQIVFGMRSTEEQVRIGATGGTAPALTFGTADAERMRIDSSGNVIFKNGALLEEGTLTDGATIAWDVNASPVAKVTLGGNRTISAPSNSAGAGQFISLLVIQDGTGSRTLTWNAVYEFASDTAPTLTTTGGKGDLFVFRYNGTKWLEVGRNLNLSLS